MTKADDDRARRPHGTGSVYYDRHRRRWVGTYEAGWTNRGTRRRRKVSAATEKGARAKLLKAIREDEPGAPATSSRPTVKRWAEQWLEVRMGDVRPSTWATDRSTVTRWIVPAIGHKRLDLLTPGDVRAVTRAILDAGRTTGSAHRAQAVLEKMLRDALSEGHRIPEAALMVKGPGVSENDRDAIPLADALDLLTAAVDTPDESRWVAALLQGMRPAECLGLTWDAIDLGAEQIDVSWQLKRLPYRVPRDRTSGFRVPDGFVARRIEGGLHLVRPKTRSGRRVIPLVPWMADALARWRQDAPPSEHGLVWPAAGGGPRTDAEDRAAWYALQDAAQVAQVDHDGGRRYLLYECRHTTATLLRVGGADDQTITAIMGHASILSTNAYLHADGDRMRAAMEGLAARLGLGAPRLPSAASGDESGIPGL